MKSRILNTFFKYLDAVLTVIADGLAYSQREVEMPTATDILNVERSQLGQCENPPGSNSTKYGKWFGVDGVAWCAEFQVWSFNQVPGGAALIHNLHTYYSGDILEAGRRLGEEVPLEQAAPGDIVIFDWGDGGITDHIGIVESHTPGSTTVHTIEGNTSDCVARRDRTEGPKCMMWLIRPKYSSTPTPPPKKIEQEDDDMYEAIMGKAALVPSWADGAGMKCYLDFSNQANVVSKIRLSARRDNGDRTDPAWSATWTKDILEEGTFRLEVGKDLKLVGGVTVKVEVLAGGPVTITRKQTLS